MSKGSRRRPEARHGAYAEAYERIFGRAAPLREAPPEGERFVADKHTFARYTRAEYQRIFGAYQRADGPPPTHEE